MCNTTAILDALLCWTEVAECRYVCSQEFFLAGESDWPQHRCIKIPPPSVYLRSLQRLLEACECYCVAVV